MGLLVWLPLNGNLNNQGLGNITITNSGGTISNDGKIGKCYEVGSGKYISGRDLTFNSPEWSIAAWVFSDGNSYSGTAYLASLHSSNSANDFYGGIEIDSSTTFICRVAGTKYTFGTITTGVWHHLVVTFKNNVTNGYVDGVLLKSLSTTTPTATATKLEIGRRFGQTSYYFSGKVNDFRVYDHCLSAREVREVSRGLVYHYKLEGSETPPVANLFAGTAFTPDVIGANFVTNGSTDWTKMVRFYNGSAAIHTFSNTIPGEDTIRLTSNANLGIAFVRKATDIGLSPSYNYTISCKAKCTNASFSLAIGTSYYTTANAWVWRGGQNAVAFGTANTWKTFTYTFKPDNNTQYICYCFTVKPGSNTTNSFTIKECKLERGSAATEWAPAVIDSIYEPPLTVDTGMDCSGFCRNGTIVGDITTVDPSPRYQNAISMNNTGTSNHIEADPIPCSDNIFSISFWVKCAKSTNQVLVADPKISIGLLNSLLYVSTSSSAPFTTTNFISDGWNHIVVVRNGSTYSAYINGIAETRSGSNNYYQHTASKLWLLNRNTNNTYAANASISDFRVYASALSASDIKDLYNSPAFVDKGQTFGGFEFTETNMPQSIAKTGIINGTAFEETTEATIGKDGTITANQILEI